MRDDIIKGGLTHGERIGHPERSWAAERASPQRRAQRMSRGGAGIRSCAAGVLAMASLSACTNPAEPLARPTHPQSVVLMVTPKMIPDFSHPDAAAAQLFAHYGALTSRSVETIVIFAVGNSDHILDYQGSHDWARNIEWARTTDFKIVSERTLNYVQIHDIIRAFRTAAAAAGVKVKVYDQIDSGGEFTPANDFKYVSHPECTNNKWFMFDIRGRLHADGFPYATAPTGVAEGKQCGEFLADQTAAYMHDLGFDGILFGNQLGTRGRWDPSDGVGYTAEEAAAIDVFLAYTRRVFLGKDLMWFDSYNNVDVERRTFSFPSDGYRFFDYMIASGFCVITDSDRYIDNLDSKLRIANRPRVLATLDYVDPWYTYNSMTEYPDESARLEQIAIDHRSDIDGIMFFANDETGGFVPRNLIDSFASRFFGSP
jgi:hypothetical protein